MDEEVKDEEAAPVPEGPSLFARAFPDIDSAPIYQLQPVPWPEKLVPVPAPTVVGYAPQISNMMLAAETYAGELAAARNMPRQEMMATLEAARGGNLKLV